MHDIFINFTCCFDSCLTCYAKKIFLYVNTMEKMCLIVFLSMFSICCAWDQSELEIFDLVEEINQNFYDLLGVPQVSTDQVS